MEQVSNEQKIAVRQLVRRSSSHVLATMHDGSTMSGTGVVLKRMGPAALVLTNAHVVSNGLLAEKTLIRAAGAAEGQPGYVVRVLGPSADEDYALLVVPDPNTALGQPVEIAPPINKGAYVVAVGNPLGEEFLIDDGNVLDVVPTAFGPKMLHSALIERGSSGGGLFNSRGQLVGINTFLLSDGKTGVALDATPIRETRAYHVRVDPRADWQDSGILFDPATQDAQVVAVGAWTVGFWNTNVSAAGVAPSEGHSIDQSLGHGALIAQVGRTARPFAVDGWRDDLPVKSVRMTEISGTSAGVIRFRANDRGQSDNSGYIDVFVVVGPKR